MPAPISEDLRERAVRLHGKGSATYDDIAELLDMGRASVSRFLRLKRESGSVAPKPATGGRRPRLSDEDTKILVEMLGAKPDLTLDALTEQWCERFPHLAVSSSTVGRRLRGAGITLKKSRSGPSKSSAKT